MKRRDITLGEMQDECKKRGQCGSLYGVPKCPYTEVCPYQQNKRVEFVDLTDPPRFTEAQMALLRAFKQAGVDRIFRSPSYGYMMYNTLGHELTLHGYIGLEQGETLDLAELLGKDGAE